MAQKEELIQKLIKEPKDFSDSELNELLNDETFSAKDLRPILIRLHTIN